MYLFTEGDASVGSQEMLKRKVCDLHCTYMHLNQLLTGVGEGWCLQLAPGGGGTSRNWG